jgi:hypothetical protein
MRQEPLYRSIEHSRMSILVYETNNIPKPREIIFFKVRGRWSYSYNPSKEYIDIFENKRFKRPGITKGLASYVDAVEREIERQNHCASLLNKICILFNVK